MESQSHHGKARILYAQSRVAVHPTPYAAHNQSGFLTLLERVQGDGDSSTPSSSSLAQRNQTDIFLVWLPETTAKQRGDVAKLIEVELREAEGLRSGGRECEAASRESNDGEHSHSRQRTSLLTLRLTLMTPSSRRNLP